MNNIKPSIIKSFLYSNNIKFKTKYCTSINEFKTIIKYKGLKHKAFNKKSITLIQAFNNLLYWCEEGPFKNADTLVSRWNTHTTRYGNT